MTPHDHRTFVPGCYRCELGRDEARDAADWMHEVAFMAPEEGMEAFTDWLEEQDYKFVYGGATREDALDEHPGWPSIAGDLEDGLRKALELIDSDGFDRSELEPLRKLLWPAAAHRSLAEKGRAMIPCPACGTCGPKCPRPPASGCPFEVKGSLAK